jgi:hypothetical protein
MDFEHNKMDKKNVTHGIDMCTIDFGTHEFENYEFSPTYIIRKDMERVKTTASSI